MSPALTRLLQPVMEEYDRRLAEKNMPEGVPGPEGSAAPVVP